MVELNNRIATIINVPNNTSFEIDIDTSAFTTYTPTGTSHENGGFAKPGACAKDVDRSEVALFAGHACADEAADDVAPWRMALASGANRLVGFEAADFERWQYAYDAWLREPKPS